jgi:hypothetical protein
LRLGGKEEIANRMVDCTAFLVGFREECLILGRSTFKTGKNPVAKGVSFP